MYYMFYLGRKGNFSKSGEAFPNPEGNYSKPGGRKSKCFSSANRDFSTGYRRFQIKKFLLAFSPAAGLRERARDAPTTRQSSTNSDLWKDIVRQNCCRLPPCDPAPLPGADCLARPFEPAR